MKTPVLLAGHTNGPSNSAVNYWPGLTGASIASGTWQTAAAAAETPVPVAGTISGLTVRVPTALTQGSYLFQLLKNGTAVLSVTIDTSNQSGSDSTSVSVAAGDKLALKITPTGTPTAQGQIQAAFVFDGSGSATALFSQAVGAAVSGTNIFAVPGVHSPNTITANTTRLGVMPCAGSMSSLYVALSAAPGGATNRSVTVVKNGVDTALTVTISGSNTTGNITGQNVTWAAGDTITIRCGTTTTVAARVMIGLDWTPTNAGEVPIFGMFAAAPSTSATVYCNVSGTNVSTEATETNVLTIAPIAFDIIGFRADVGTAPGNAKHRVFTVRNGAAGSLADTAATVDITGAAATSATWSGTVNVASQSLLSAKTVPSSTPAAAGSAKISAAVKVGVVSIGAGLSSETDGSIGLGLAFGLGRSSEGAAALALGATQIRTAGLATESDSALSRPAVLIRSAGLSTEADLDLALTARQIRALSLTTETDSALGLAAVQARSTGPATEADAALACSALQTRSLSLASESDAPVALAAVQIRSAGVATEADVAIGVSFFQRRATALSTEVDSSVQRALGLGLGAAAEADGALALAGKLAALVGLSTEADSALALAAGGFAGAVGAAAETDTVVGLTIALGVGPASEVESALALASALRGYAGLAVENDNAVGLTAIQIAAATVAAENDNAIGLVAVQVGALGIASETDVALALSPPHASTLPRRRTGSAAGSSRTAAVAPEVRRQVASAPARRAVTIRSSRVGMVSRRVA